MGEGEGEGDVSVPSSKSAGPVQVDEKCGLRMDGMKGIYLCLCLLAEKDWTEGAVGGFVLFFVFCFSLSLSIY